MVPNKKPSAYQKLKAENQRLKADLLILATEPESEKGISIRMEWVSKAFIERAIWSGDSNMTFMSIGVKVKPQQ